MCSINNQTNSSNVWKKIKSINGTIRNNSINLLIDDKLSTSLKEVADTLGILFHSPFSNTDYDQDFLNSSRRYANRKNTVDHFDINQILLNTPLKVEELKDALSQFKRKAPNPTGFLLPS